MDASIAFFCRGGSASEYRIYPQTLCRRSVAVNTVSLKVVLGMPLIVTWPGRVYPGVSDALVSQVDFPVSLGAWVGAKTDSATMPDSQNVLAAILGKSQAAIGFMVEQAQGLALRQGDWKYVAPGKVTDHLGPWKNSTIPALGWLFNLAADPGEARDIAVANPDKLKELASLLTEIQGLVGRIPLAQP